MIYIRVASIINESIVDGPGLRMVIFAQGCNRGCPDCHNPETHEVDGGYEISCDDILSRARKNPLLRGLTFSGGEPFLQAKAFAYLANAAKDTGGSNIDKPVENMNGLCSSGASVAADLSGLDIIAYTGFTYEELLEGATNENSWLELLSQTDILVDGPFIKSQLTYELPFRGSNNQRAIDVKASLARNEIVLHDY